MSDPNEVSRPGGSVVPPRAVEAEIIAQVVAAASIIVGLFSSGVGLLSLVFFGPPIAVLDAGLYALVRARGGKARTGILAWAFYTAALHHPAVLVCGVVTRLVSALEPRYHLVMLAVVAATLALWPGAMGGVSQIVEGRQYAVSVASVLGAAAAGIIQWWSLWRRRAEERADSVDPVRLAAKAEEAAAREREEAEAIRRMFRS